MLKKEDISRISGIALEKLEGYKEVVELCGKEVDGLPDGLDFLGLSLRDCPLTELPEDLPVQYLSVMGCPNLKHLPKGLELVHLYLFDSDIETIPENSSCYAILILMNCPQIRRLPACCKAIARDFVMENCPAVTSLPALEVVHGEFNLRNVSVTSLPENLKVGGSLWLLDTPIETIPATIKVGADMIINGCKNLKFLPEGLKVNGNLDLSGSSIEQLPKDLIVKGDLNITDTAISSLPEDLIVGGEVIASGQVMEGGTVNHEVPDNLAELIWKNSGYIYADTHLYRIMSKEAEHWKVLSAFEDAYFIHYGYDNFIAQSLHCFAP